jgi:hypothetical protein
VWSVEPLADLRAAVRTAFAAGAEWIHSADASELASETAPQVFAQGDGNIANFLWAGDRCRLVDFEDSGRSTCRPGCPAYSRPKPCSNASSWSRRPSSVSCTAHRALAFYLLLMLLPGGPAHRHNPPGFCELQARRLLQFLV